MDTSKQQYHCDGCGICRVGGRANYTHCPRCSVCYTNETIATHTCVENALENDCPVCLVYLYVTTL